jgi:glycosyltransferase involved in cell wall biosynthesis
MAKVLLVGKGQPERGGIPSFIQMLLDSDLHRLHDVTFLNLARDVTPQGGKASFSNLRRTAADALELWGLAAGKDVVHIHSSLGPSVTLVRAGLLALVARARGCQVLVHAHGGLVLLWLSGWRRRMLVRVALSPAHLVLVVSSQLRERLAASLPPGRVVLVDNGIEPFRFRGTSVAHDPPRILYVGLLTPRKGVLDLLSASEQLSAQGLRHEVWLVGGTPDEGPEAATPVREAAGRVGARLLGQRAPEEMAGLYREGDVFCLPSWWEAMPLSILEAMASGLPVVATDVGDVSRAVRPGLTGSLVAPRDVVGLTSALHPLLLDPALRQDLGRAGRQRVIEQFSSGATTRDLDRIYRGRGARRS